MPGFKIIEHKGKRIFFLDGRKADRDIAMRGLEEYHRQVIQEPLNSVLLLDDFRDCYADGKLVRKFQQRAKEHNKHVKKIAVVGVKGLIKVAFSAYSAFINIHNINANKKIKLFNDLEMAKNWLVED